MGRSGRGRWGARIATAPLLASLVLVAVGSPTTLAVEVPVKPGKPICRGKVATIIGTRGPDVIRGTAGPDVVVARGGADDIRGKGGDDVICGGRGKDLIRGGRGDDILRGGGGKDRILGNADDDIIRGESGDDRLFGGRGCDQLWGGRGDDDLDGGTTSGCEYRPRQGQPLWHSDLCRQGPGSGTRIDCEGAAIADLAVTSVTSPAEVDGKTVTVTMTVTNHGPEVVPYLALRGTSTWFSAFGHVCGEASHSDMSPLGVGDSRVYELTFDCTYPEPLNVTFVVAAHHYGLDRDFSNDRASTETHVE